MMADSPEDGFVSMPAAIALLRNQPDLRKLEDGEYLFRVGDPGDAMYGVVEGAIDVSAGDVLVEQVRPGGVLGEMSVLEGKPRTAAARAVGSTLVARIDEERFAELVKVNPYFALEVMRVLSYRLRRESSPPSE
jgi:CRP-like cAMP-binding protein